MSENTDPETLTVRWLSSCQSFSMIAMIGIEEDGDEKEIVPISFQPMVGAVAVKYSYDNSFSVFIGVSSQRKEEGDIAYIKRMGQRQPEDIARALFPQYSDMDYHK